MLSPRDVERLVCGGFFSADFHLLTDVPGWGWQMFDPRRGSWLLWNDRHGRVSFLQVFFLLQRWWISLRWVGSAEVFIQGVPETHGNKVTCTAQWDLHTFSFWFLQFVWSQIRIWTSTSSILKLVINNFLWKFLRTRYTSARAPLFSAPRDQRNPYLLCQ